MKREAEKIEFEMTNEFLRILAHKTKDERLNVSRSYTAFGAFPVPSLHSILSTVSYLDVF